MGENLKENLKEINIDLDNWRYCRII